MSGKETTVYLGLGSNLGQREENLQQALQLLRQKITIIKVSSFYDTEPVGYAKQANFVNAVCQTITSYNPEELFKFIKKIEFDMGRIANFPGGPRIIDIDILFYGSEIINSPQLTIPHPRIAERAFVLIPLTEIAPGLVHPVSHKTVQELVALLDKTKKVKRLTSFVSKSIIPAETRIPKTRSGTTYRFPPRRLK